jgi:hypothetical protein
MLIIGGVAVQLSSLPTWAQHLSAFFPGRYAVEAMQASVTGAGLTSVRLSLLALLLIGAAAGLAGARMFRWDAQQRFAMQAGKGWLGVALAAWVAVGLIDEARGHIETPAREQVSVQSTTTQPPAIGSSASQLPNPPPSHAVLPTPTLTPAEQAAVSTATNKTTPAGRSSPPEKSTGRNVAPQPSAGATPPPPGPVPSGASLPSWQQVTLGSRHDVRRCLLMAVSSPHRAALDQEQVTAIETLRVGLVSWPPGKVAGSGAAYQLPVRRRGA